MDIPSEITSYAQMNNLHRRFEQLINPDYLKRDKKQSFDFKKIGESPWFGCELEITFDTYTDKFKCFNELYLNKNHFHITSDLSIKNGFEIVTDVMGIREMCLFFKSLLATLKKYNAKCDSSCGLHIHIDKTPEMEEKVKSLFKIDLQKKFELVGLREMNKYCKMNTSDWSKYHAANITGHVNTIELRFFRCTLVLKNILRYLLFAYYLVTKPLEFIKEKYDLKMSKSEIDSRLRLLLHEAQNNAFNAVKLYDFVASDLVVQELSNIVKNAIRESIIRNTNELLKITSEGQIELWKSKLAT